MKPIEITCNAKALIYPRVNPADTTNRVPPTSALPQRKTTLNSLQPKLNDGFFPLPSLPYSASILAQLAFLSAGVSGSRDNEVAAASEKYSRTN